MNWNKILDDSAVGIRSITPPSTLRNEIHYAHWLSQTYHFVSHSTSLLGYALPFLHDERLKAVFEHHLSEESRHDLLALKDIEHLGATLSPPSFYTEAFYQSQYYRIQFEGGKSLLGYILFLENLAVTWGKELYADLHKVHPRSMLFLKVHAEEDVTHVARAISLIESLSKMDQKIIERNFNYSETIYTSMLSEGSDIMQKNVA